MKTNLADIGHKSRQVSLTSPQTAPPAASLYKLAGQWEGFLFRERCWKTYERYGRALSRFLEAFPGRRDVNSFVRPEIIDWVNARLAEGASLATIRTELAAVRSFFQFCVDMKVAMINPAKGIKVTRNSQTKAPTDGIIQPCRERGGSSAGDSA